MRTDMTKLIAAFGSSAEAPKNNEVVHGEETEVLDKQRFRELARNAKFRTT